MNVAEPDLIRGVQVKSSSHIGNMFLEGDLLWKVSSEQHGNSQG